MSIRSVLLFCCLVLCSAPVCEAGQFKVSSGALERTLKARLFSTTDQRYYLRGDAHSVCNLYTEDPHLSFSGERILVRVHTGGKYGREIAGHCIGFPVSMNTVISLAPSAEGETIGVTDARLDRLSDSSELNFILWIARIVPERGQDEHGSSTVVFRPAAVAATKTLESHSLIESPNNKTGHVFL